LGARTRVTRGETAKASPVGWADDTKEDSGRGSMIPHVLPLHRIASATVLAASTMIAMTLDTDA
jgi:hypothetical protein